MLIAIILCFLLFLVMVMDVKSFTIPNWLNALILVLFFPVALISPVPVDWLGSLYAFWVIFAVGFTIFAMRWMGGGDIKLLIALAPWCGWGEPLLQFVLYMALYGGLLSVVLYMLRLTYPVIAHRREDWANRPVPRILTHGEPAPYGLAIAAGFITLMLMDKVPLIPLALG